MINKPEVSEYSPFAAGYVALAMQHTDVMQLLNNLMDTTATLLSTLPEGKANYAYAPGKWTIKQVLGHLIDTERIFAYRALCIARGEQQSLPGFDQDDYMANSRFNEIDMLDLVAEFIAVRLSTKYFLKSLSTSQADTIGLCNGTETSVRALAYMIAGHELHHLHILKERYL